MKLAKRTIDESVRDLDVGVVQPLAGATSFEQLVRTEIFIDVEVPCGGVRSIVFSLMTVGTERANAGAFAHGLNGVAVILMGRPNAGNRGVRLAHRQGGPRDGPRDRYG